MQNINLEEYKGVFVFAQQVDNEISSIALELLGEAGRLAKPLNTEVTAVLLGSKVGNLVDKLAEYGADKVIVVDDPELETNSPRDKKGSVPCGRDRASASAREL